jgi:hypothetical protein
MAIARAKLVDLTVTRWYHCVSRCVRKAFLLGEGDHNRKEWLENRLEELSDIFAVAVGGFSVMDNHMHVLLRIDPEVAQFEGRFKSVGVVDEESLLKIQAGRVHRPALSAGNGLDFGGDGGDFRAARFERRDLARRDGQAPRRAFAGPYLREPSRQTAGNRRILWRAAPGQPAGLSVALKRFSLADRSELPTLDRRGRS